MKSNSHMPANLLHHAFWISLATLSATATFAEEIKSPVKATKSEIAAFVAADLDKSITLTAEEFKAFVDKMAEDGETKALTIRLMGLYNYAFKKIDKNIDGVVTPQELRSANDDYKRTAGN
ncbi:hypothetical protein [Rhizobium sp. L1K21]|uniref:hypothetical protein n=1 Tax=Rhizobium sp. L1K21 TaxID=2954933 RepID=UPI0020920DB1|nr:hypothetical protein [Rhizobium sp. L1K21]MCO6185288.1 hypothetical protein [Rhizobium sp. L1K21]